MLLAGDAAHVMPPFAGQGFSSGARDAANLAWKLEAVLRGRARGRCCDTYEHERRPHVQAMSRLAVSLGRLRADARTGGSPRIRDALPRRRSIAAASPRWVQERIKPVPAYGDGRLRGDARSGSPSGAASARSSRSRRCSTPPASRSCSIELAGPGWCALATDSAAADAARRATAFGCCSKAATSSMSDGEVGAWLGRFGADWVVLRPDRFVFALGVGAAGGSVRALDELHRRAGAHGRRRARCKPIKDAVPGVSALTPQLITLLDRFRLGTLATQAPDGRPRQSVVYFAREGERLSISTEASRWKARDVERTGWASISVRGDEPPFPSATISGAAEILTRGIGPATAAVMRRILDSDEPPPEQTDDALAEVGRVILSLRIERVTAATYLDHL